MELTTTHKRAVLPVHVQAMHLFHHHWKGGDPTVWWRNGEWQAGWWGWERRWSGRQSGGKGLGWWADESESKVAGRTEQQGNGRKNGRSKKIGGKQYGEGAGDEWRCGSCCARQVVTVEAGEWTDLWMRGTVGGKQSNKLPASGRAAGMWLSQRAKKGRWCSPKSCTGSPLYLLYAAYLKGMHTLNNFYLWFLKSTCTCDIESNSDDSKWES